MLQTVNLVIIGAARLMTDHTVKDHIKTDKLLQMPADDCTELWGGLQHWTQMEAHFIEEWLWWLAAKKNRNSLFFVMQELLDWRSSDTTLYWVVSVNTFKVSNTDT